MNFKFMAVGLAIAWMAIAAIMLSTPPAFALNPSDGAAIFELHCAGCHSHGGNIVRRGKTLKQKALERNGVASLDAIAQLVTHGKGNMSAYGDRLTSEEIQTVAAYVLQQAEQGWKD